MSKLLTSKQVAALLGLSDSYLRKMRLEGSGPLFIKIGRAVRYEPDSVDAFINDRRRTQTA